jgi:hypothetical protein
MTRSDPREKNSNPFDQDGQGNLPYKGRDAPRWNMVRKETAIRFNLECFLGIVLVEDHQGRLAVGQLESDELHAGSVARLDRSGDAP